MSFFDTDEPYEIVNNMTNSDELAPDLVAHVYLIMQSKENILNEKGYFISIASKQWKLHNSEFNRLYRPYFTTELTDNLTEEDNDVFYDGKYKQFLDDYINKTPETAEDWYIREVALLWMDGMTYAQINKQFKINNRYISEAIKQFKNDVLNSYNSHINNINSEQYYSPSGF
jgi:hypothetical protein